MIYISDIYHDIYLIFSRENIMLYINENIMINIMIFWKYHDIFKWKYHHMFKISWYFQKNHDILFWLIISSMKISSCFLFCIYIYNVFLHLQCINKWNFRRIVRPMSTKWLKILTYLLVSYVRHTQSATSSSTTVTL